ncbi:acetyl-CoA carboxylase biotin carboxylase subunit [Alkalicoccus saliphilus]|jgi:acetyl-CoA carboxylase, biotin carboxylase subunit|uniref:biotin carboxylase n=1 Tax=Alkalicoccus saliphilus TaxID=200989 RepID=A0A2T4U6E8_9BACI|nr:biotin carboxylase N-terminal domain-containing protein [Alkalicoccus saliphilus]PTL38971.1 biotin carboxylase [Alkalicoccus saliphilus]
MIKKLLIANRGEIACRIIRTCRKMGITSTAVYSEADEKSMHVRMADEAVFIGGSRVKESYLNMDNVLQAAKDYGVDAIHPGYGLLSENAEFAAKVKEEGIIFIGPEENIIEKMGDKIEARQVMEKAGVPVVPGAVLATADETEAVKAGRSIGYPLMVKAAAGGGGIGMQKVENEEELHKAVASVIKKAETFFGSASLFLEKYVEGARHIEAQVAGDYSGGINVIGTRDCSIQRRHQKVIEEAPPPNFSAEGEKVLRTAAETAAGALNYTNAGTVEFLVDKDESVYFLEMNTRLQVEHPVTEETSGIDLVEWQIRIAMGERLEELPLKKDRAAYSLEVRIYAEDPKTFFPSPGKITKWKFPEEEGIRYDVGFDEGDTVTPYYDPMIGKIICSGEDRHSVITKLADVLERAEVEGIKTNIPMLIDILKDQRFQKGEVTTHFLMQTQ